MNKYAKIAMAATVVAAISFSVYAFAGKIVPALGYVPKSQLDDANARLTAASKDLEQAQLDILTTKKEDYTQIVADNAQLIAMSKELKETQASLAEWQARQCVGPDGQTVLWTDLDGKYALYNPVPKYRADKLMMDFHFRVVLTEWKSREDFDPYGDLDIILIDALYPDSLAVNITKDCVILGPNFLP